MLSFGTWTRRGSARTARPVQPACELPAPYFVVDDSITAPMVGEHHFRRHCVARRDEAADMRMPRMMTALMRPEFEKRAAGH